MNTTIVIVSYKQTELIQSAHESIRRFYPEIPVIIIDGSPADSDCWTWCHNLNHPYTRVHTLEFNVGHGPGLHMGIGMATTEFVLLMDSDVVINEPKSIEHLQWFYDECQRDMRIPYTYGCGKVVLVDENGNNTENLSGIRYLHPHFALINKHIYMQHPPLINHGAPFIKTMIALEENHKMVCDTQIQLFITHKERGTRVLNPPEFNPENWDKV